MTERSSSDRCTGCTLGRRAFLREGALVAAALAAAGARASALPVRFASALASRGEQATYAIPAGDSVSIDRDREVILARTGGSLYAFALACPHQNTALKWEERDKLFECPRHHSKYLPDGTFVSGRATRSMDRYAIQRVGANVVVDLSQVFEEDHDAAAWHAAAIAL